MRAVRLPPSIAVSVGRVLGKSAVMMSRANDDKAGPTTYYSNLRWFEFQSFCIEWLAYRQSLFPRDPGRSIGIEILAADIHQHVGQNGEESSLLSILPKLLQSFIKAIVANVSVGEWVFQHEPALSFRSN